MLDNLGVLVTLWYPATVVCLDLRLVYPDGIWIGFGLATGTEPIYRYRTGSGGVFRIEGLY